MHTISMYSKDLKYKVRVLWKQGKSYGEINGLLKLLIPKATLATWCKGVGLPKSYRERLKADNRVHLGKARKLSVSLGRYLRNKKLLELQWKNRYLGQLLENFDNAKIALAMLYLGEGGKGHRRGGLVFGNADPRIIKLYLKLLQVCYQVDLSKLRCTVQCRADQDIERLQEFWYTITRIPLTQFYKAQVDKRTLGIPTLKVEYKGVCRIDCLSAGEYYDLLQTIEVLLGP